MIQSSIVGRLQTLRERRRKGLRDLQCVKDGDLERPEESQLKRMQEYESGELDEAIAYLSSQSPAHGVRKALRTLVPVYIDGIDFGKKFFLAYFGRYYFSLSDL